MTGERKDDKPSPSPQGEKRHDLAEMPIHFIDGDGDISERTADGTVRKVTKEEIEAFLLARRGQ